jgi:hypothetical protein
VSGGVALISDKGREALVLHAKNAVWVWGDGSRSLVSGWGGSSGPSGVAARPGPPN